MRFYTAILLLLFLSSSSAEANGGLSNDELNLARKTTTGEIVLLHNLPIGTTRSGPVHMRRVDIYAADARILVATDGGYSEIPRSTWAHFIAATEVPDAPRLGNAPNLSAPWFKRSRLVQ